MVTALAALEAGVVTEGTYAFCPGHYDFGNGRFHCWKKGGHGSVERGQRASGIREHHILISFSSELGIKKNCIHDTVWSW